MRPHNTQHFLERNHSHPWSGYARTKSSFVSREIPYYRILTMHFVNAIFKKNRVNLQLTHLNLRRCRLILHHCCFTAPLFQQQNLVCS